MRIPRFFGLHAKPPVHMNWTLALVPFVLLIAIYLIASDMRLRENPKDKLLPSVSKMVDSMERLVFEPERRSGKYIFVNDTISSLKRIGVGLVSAAVVGLFLGLNMGLFPGMRSILLPVITALATVPPLAILPILFISVGIGEAAKVTLIFIGVVFTITSNVYLATRRIPKEHTIKALTLGASQLGVVYRVILPQIMPCLIDTVRLSLGSAWLFLIASEAVASTDGLGYRIFLVRRYLAMDVILPYVLWITCLGFSMNWGLRKFIDWKFPWYAHTSQS